MAPGDRHAFVIETGGETIEPIGPVHVVLDIFLARPDDLYGAIDLLRDLNAARDAVDVQPPSEPAADEMIVDHDLVQGQSCRLRGRRLRARQSLCADPDFAA